MKNKKHTIVILAALAILSTVTSGCALINTALSAGIAYGIYQATK